MDFELRRAREKLDKEQRERKERAKLKLVKERKAKEEAKKQRDAIEVAQRSRRLDAIEAQFKVLIVSRSQLFGSLIILFISSLFYSSIEFISNSFVFVIMVIRKLSFLVIARQLVGECVVTFIEIILCPFASNFLYRKRCFT